MLLWFDIASPHTLMPWVKILVPRAMFTGGVSGSNWTTELPNEFIHQWSHKSKAWVGRR